MNRRSRRRAMKKQRQALRSARRGNTFSLVRAMRKPLRRVHRILTAIAREAALLGRDPAKAMKAWTDRGLHSAGHNHDGSSFQCHLQWKRWYKVNTRYQRQRAALRRAGVSLGGRGSLLRGWVA